MALVVKLSEEKVLIKRRGGPPPKKAADTKVIRKLLRLRPERDKDDKTILP